MRKDEILQLAKPILFNTDMVKAILEERKTVTRRYVKYKYSNTEMKMHTDKYGTRLIEIQKDIEGETHGKNPDGTTWHKLLGYIEPKPPYKKGDILYVREAWSEWTGGFLYRAWPEGIAQPGSFPGERWRPSIHMQKEAARIFLRVTDVRVERLHDMSPATVFHEGTKERDIPALAMCEFANIWDSTVQKKEMKKYGWAANPWVWVIEFERVEVEA